MDRYIIEVLKEFLPDDVLKEIKEVNWISKNINSISSKTEIEEIKDDWEDNNDNSEDNEDNWKENLEDNKNNPENDENIWKNNEKNLENDEKIWKNNEKNLEEIEKIWKNNEKNLEEIEKIFDFIKNNFNNGEVEKLNLKTSTQDIRYWFIKEKDEKWILDMPYFIFPTSISRIKKLLEFLKEINEVFKWIDSKNFIPNFLLDWKWEKGWNDLLINKNIKYLTFLIVQFLNNNWKQKLSYYTSYNNLNFWKISPSILKNWDFYKKFFTKDIIYIQDIQESLNNPKVQLLKYYLIKLIKTVDSKYLKWIKFLVFTYLKDVQEKKVNINIYQYKDLRQIFAIINNIINWSIKVKRQVLEKINDLYEIWLFQKIIYYFNDDAEKKIKDKLYYTINIDELNWKLNEYIKKQKCKSKNIYYSEKNIYFRDIEDLKFISLLYKNITLYKKITNKGIIKRIIECKSINKILNNFSYDDINEFKKMMKNNNIILKSNDYKKYNRIIVSNKDFIKAVVNFKVSDNINLWHGFIKEDKPEFKWLSTISLDRLSKEFTWYEFYLSLGGHNKNLCKNEQSESKKTELLSDSFCKLVWEKVRELSDILKSHELTPDFILKIEKWKKLIWTIFLDAKFSKYPFFLEENIDYAPVLKYYRELWKYFSTYYMKSNLPFKIIILFPGNLKPKELKKLNNYFQRNTNVVAVPLMIGNQETLGNNLKYLEEYIKEFAREIIRK